MNSIKTNLLVSVLTIALCLVLVTGATFALYTSEAPSSVVVSPAKLDVLATFDYEHINQFNTSTERNEWLVKGKVDGTTPGLLIVSDIAPYEGFDVNFVIQNNSAVSVKWRMEYAITCVDSEGNENKEYGNYFEVSIDDEILKPSSRWMELGIDGQSKSYDLKVTLSGDAPVYSTSMTCYITLTVFAIQGNADGTKH